MAEETFKAGISSWANGIPFMLPLLHSSPKVLRRESNVFSD